MEEKFVQNFENRKEKKRKGSPKDWKREKLSEKEDVRRTYDREEEALESRKRIEQRRLTINRTQKERKKKGESFGRLVFSSFSILNDGDDYCFSSPPPEKNIIHFEMITWTGRIGHVANKNNNNNISHFFRNQGVTSSP